MSIFQLLPQAQTLRAEVQARSQGNDTRRRSRISQASLHVYRAGAGPDSSPAFSIIIKGPAWDQTGSPPFNWLFVTGDLNNLIYPVLRIFLAPGAYIEDIGDAIRSARGAFPPSRRLGVGVRIPLALEVTRVSANSLITELGSAAQTAFSGFTPSPWSAASQRSLYPESAPATTTIWQEEATATATRSRLLREPVVTVLPDGLLITKEADSTYPQWQVRITTPLNEPAAFAYILLGPTLLEQDNVFLVDSDRRHLRRSAGRYTLRIVRTSNVDVHLAVEMSRLTGSFDLNVEYHVVNNTVRRPAGETELILPDEPVNPQATAAWNYIALVPPQGSYLNPEDYQFYTLFHDNPQSIPELRGLSGPALYAHQVVGDPIPIIGRRPGDVLGPVAPRITQNYAPELQLAIATFELAVGFIPIIGTIYDVASLLYLSAYGRSFWGESQEITYLDLLGIGFIGLGILDDAAAVASIFDTASRVFRRSLSRQRDIRYIVNHLDPPFRAAINPPSRPVLDPPEVALPTAPAPSTPPTTSAPPTRLRRQTVDVSAFTSRTFSTRGQELMVRAEQQARQRLDRDRRNLEKAIKEIGEGNEEVIAHVFVDAPNDLVNRLISSTSPAELADRILREATGYVAPFLEHHERTRLLAVFTPDFRGFRNDILRKGYSAYITRRGAAAASPRDWALMQRTGQYRPELILRLGQGFEGRIQRALQTGITTPLDRRAVGAFQQLQQRVQPYSALVQSRSGEATRLGINQGGFFDGDHLLEKRFINRIRAQLPDFDTGSLHALIVPKNQVVLQRMQSIESALVTYDHSVKTQLMRTLIPYQEEVLFSLQQWYGAHVWVYMQLPARDIDQVLSALDSDFQRLASELNETIALHRDFRTPNLLPSNQIGRISSTRIATE